MRSGLILVGYALAAVMALLLLALSLLGPLKTPVVYSVSVGDLLFLPLVLVYGYSVYLLGKRLALRRCAEVEDR